MPGRRGLRNERVAGPLREQTEKSRDEQSTAHAGGAEHVPPRLFGLLEFDLDGALDLRQFGLDDNRVAVALRVVLGENVEGVVVAVLTDQVSGAFREEPAQVSMGAIAVERASYITVMIWTMAGAICSRDGIRHAQLDGIVTVPRPTAAATIWPMK